MSGQLEFALIERLRERLQGSADAAVPIGIGDDAAVLIAPGALAIAVDTLVEGTHFLPGTDPAAIAAKALAVNLSDLAAMGAQPRWALLALTLPRVEQTFIDAFIRGWADLAAAHGVSLIGGDTTRGPLALSVTLLGIAPAQPLTRSGAAAGDELWLSGVCGEAAAGLAVARGELAPAAADAAHLRARLQRPTPRVALGQALVGVASAAIDVSDGLLADLRHVLAASAVGARVDASRLPLSAPLLRAVPDPAQRRRWQLAGGDDYELLFTAPPAAAEAVLAAARASATPVTCIGSIGGSTLSLHDDGRPLALPEDGFSHFG